MLIHLFLSLIVAGRAEATAPAGTLINHIELSKGGYIALQVTSSESQSRQFLVTCETNLPSEKINALTLAQVSHIPLRAKGYQSLINYWLQPAVDNYIVCTDKITTKRKK
ncbi:MAG: hypothetical protein A4S09_10220 [Proteobacteria bacterium SG_bin7]|nr:MAG: hypothetical protein A4S09_10220 [Proteobacteria bacterium SG_bin7]